jgi:hypothetical protein
MQRWIDRRGQPDELDDTPLEMPTALKEPESLEAMMARLMESRYAMERMEQGYGDFEDENDFEDEDPNLLNMTPYELTEMEDTAHEFPASPDELPNERSVDPQVAPSENENVEPAEAQAVSRPDYTIDEAIEVQKKILEGLEQKKSGMPLT